MLHRIRRIEAALFISTLRTVNRPVRTLLFVRNAMSSSKRKAPLTQGKPSPKRAKVEVPEYHLTPSIKNEDGTIQWPAPSAQVDRAREIILQRSVNTEHTTAIFVGGNWTSD
jgi:hypothetical protein